MGLFSSLPLFSLLFSSVLFSSLLFSSFLFSSLRFSSLLFSSLLFSSLLFSSLFPLPFPPSSLPCRSSLHPLLRSFLNSFPSLLSSSRLVSSLLFSPRNNKNPQTTARRELKPKAQTHENNIGCNKKSIQHDTENHPEIIRK